MSTISLYQINDDKKYLYKTPKELFSSIEIVFKEDTSILNPSVLLKISNSTNLFNCNYAYIDTLKRWYFIDDIIIVRNGLYQIKLSVDVLYTYRSQIVNLEGIVERQEMFYNPHLADNQFPLQTNKYITTVPIGKTNLPTATYVMIMSGSEHT